MKFISCASYYGTGSSAITDLVSEYEGVFNFANWNITLWKTGTATTPATR